MTSLQDTCNQQNSVKNILCIKDHMYILYLNVFYKKNVRTSIHIDSILMTISSEVSTRKCLTMAKTNSQLGVKLVYVKISGMWLIYDCSGIHMVYESH